MIPNACLLLVFFGIGMASTTSGLYTSIHLNSTWSTFCPQNSSFKTGLARFITSKLMRVISESLIEFTNLDSSCSVAQLATVNVNGLNTKIMKDRTSVDVSRTTDLVSFLRSGADINEIQVLGAKLISSKPETTTHKFSIQTILIIIGVVLVVYIVGFGCILFTQSDDSDAKGRPKAYVISTMNKGFAGRERNVHSPLRIK